MEPDLSTHFLAFEARAKAAFEKARKDMSAHWATVSPETHFNIYDIAAWERLAREASVPFVPLEKLATWSVDEVILSNTPPRIPNHAVNKLAKPMSVARWSHCTGEFAKLYMAVGGGCGWNADMASASFNDDRVYELLLDYPEPMISLYRREWVPARVVDGFPVEYRVFVSSGVVTGISNYYLQRPLPNDARTLRHIATAYSYAALLAHHQKLPLNLPPKATVGLDAERAAAAITGNWFTVDFMERERGGLVMIDGGPPFGLGADPCCFSIDEVPSGIALEDRSGRSAPRQGDEE